jgi:hypothetical protein
MRLVIGRRCCVAPRKLRMPSTRCLGGCRCARQSEGGVARNARRLLQRGVAMARGWLLAPEMHLEDVQRLRDNPKICFDLISHPLKSTSG